MTTVDAALNSQVKALADSFVESGRQIGIQVCVYGHGEKIVETVAGQMGPEDPRPMQPDTLINAFSVTKGVASTAMHILVDRGQIDLDAPVARYWPKFGQHGKDRVTVRQAMSHQVGLYAMRRPFKPEHASDWDAGIRYMEDGVPAWEPGTATGYHAFTWAWIVGGIVQGATGRHIKDVIREEIAEPVGVADEFYVGIPDGVEDRLATLDVTALGQNALVPPEHAMFDAMPPDMWPYFNTMEVRKACVPSGNGHFSARAVARMYAALANGGEIDGVRLLSSAQIADATKLVTAEPDRVIIAPIRKASGYFLGGVTDGIHGPMGPCETTFGHPGAGGAVAFADPVNGLGIAVIHNKMANEGPGQGTSLEICDLVRRELGATC
ncbi:MAG: serine hydrolase domain-containing protein [Dehalococcoidia bacterium]